MQEAAKCPAGLGKSGTRGLEIMLSLQFRLSHLRLR